jgi:hypothetical protein
VNLGPTSTLCIDKISVFGGLHQMLNGLVKLR